MAIRVSYQPSPLISGPVAQTAGQGFFQQYADKFNLGQHEVSQRERLARFGEANTNLRTTAELQSREAIAAAQLQAQQVRDYQNYIASQQAMQAEMANAERARQFGFMADVTRQRMQGFQQAALNRQRFGYSAWQDERDFQQQQVLLGDEQRFREQMQEAAGQQAMDRITAEAGLRTGQMYTQSGLGMIAQMRQQYDWSPEQQQRIGAIDQQMQNVRRQMDDGQLTPQQFGQVEQRFMRELSTMLPQQRRTAQEDFEKRFAVKPEYGFLGVMQPDGQWDLRPYKNEQAVIEQKRLFEAMKSQNAWVESITDTASKLVERSIDPITGTQNMTVQQAFQQSAMLHRMAAAELQQLGGGAVPPWAQQGQPMPEMPQGPQAGANPMQQKLGTISQNLLGQIQQNPQAAGQLYAPLEAAMTLQSIMQEYPDIKVAPEPVKAEYAKAAARLGLVK